METVVKQFSDQEIICANMEKVLAAVKEKKRRKHLAKKEKHRNRGEYQGIFTAFGLTKLMKN